MEKVKLKREIGVIGFTAHMVNMVVGSGIFVLPAIVASGLGPSSVFAYLFCIVIVALVMLCFAEVGSRVAASGGAYVYIRTAFGPYIGFLTSILFVWSTLAADAAVANAIVDILGTQLPMFKWPPARMLVFFFLFLIFGFVNFRGAKHGVAVVKLATIAKLIPLLILIMASWGDVAIENLEIQALPSFRKVAEMTLILFFAFQGAESALSISGEVKNPQRTIPKGILVSILIIFMLYVLVQTVAQGVLGPTLPTYRENPLGAVAERVFGGFGFAAMTLAALISMLGYLGSSILSMPRVLFQAAVDGVLPMEKLAKIHPRFSTPFMAIGSYAAIGFLCASFGGFEQLAIISSATILLIYLGVSLAVIKLRMHDEEPRGGFKIPYGYGIPVLSSFVILCLLSHVAIDELIVIVVVVTLLTVFYFVRPYFRKNN
ncbi:APC family permease [Muricauda oceani]|uniref:Amino acid permease n=1 Tax=Flagellimonas oceani TaxID=2698672 RepID=A0A6G7IZB2_9FLAO|nr:APC family permease [Allomuricauda oceani]MBW8243699.1 APC family permease [Allomuricauda oceani]QII43941.1 amino acid permease [Allomuricauda oceani]